MFQHLKPGMNLVPYHLQYI